MNKRVFANRLAGTALGLVLATPFAAAQAPKTPPAGTSLTMTLGPGWSSNPGELPGRQKGDGYFSLDTTLSHRWALWDGGALTLSGSGYSELYVRDDSNGIHRLASSLTLSQRWQEATFTLGVSARTAANQRLTAHDSASQDIALGISRSFTLAEKLAFTITGGVSRRFYQDGAEHQLRARAGATLARTIDKWTFRIGGGFSYALEDKTPLLPRINDRTISANIGATYEWEKDREVSLKMTWSRTYSSLPINRFRTFGIVPQAAATLRF